MYACKNFKLYYIKRLTFKYDQGNVEELKYATKIFTDLFCDKLTKQDENF